MKNINFKLICVLFAVFFAVSCSKDFLERPSLSEISTENFYQTKEELRLATAGLYAGKVWGEYHNRAIIAIGDVLGGNLVLPWGGQDLVELNTFTLSGTNDRLVSCWKGLYFVVGHCNATINGIENAPATIAEADKNAAIAEARFIRAMAYYHLVMTWGEVPIYEDYAELISSPLVNKNIVADGYRFITEDLIFAAENLPETDEKGRVTSWSAKGLLSKVYLTMAGLGQSGGTRNQEYLDLAKNYAKDVIENSGSVLLPSYKDLFKTQFNDNPESLFALQWTSPSGGWGEGNMNLTMSPSNDIVPQKELAFGGPSPSYDLYLAYTEQDSIRRKATIMLPGDYYEELNAAEGGYTCTLPAMKKHIIGNEVDNNFPAMTTLSSIEHNSLLRLADVYLIYAEAILGNNASTTNAEALLYFNMVRERAGVDPLTELNTDIILKERRLEFACEGQYWYDLVRLSYYNPVKAIEVLNTQISNDIRVRFDYDEDTEIATPNDPIGIITPASVGTFTLQLPSLEIIANPKLNEPAVPYY
ncbi:RagB/SusD family nutrient uptake outer membrane protein [Confluentibacter flavum]|uniref:RagB/SusD family nutrient uptake outer membrane protein n=1 Tax=Confluentibacter flavum TaxID=1909700 RepID=A0A2N3HNV0_9FLAO|nr:RagB/SusD family nutrient uptake outer membrane protein [Confluentibacter flavum]PKQ46625.1 RagB/SusD family nutrient uptake outer membrane protein [Confluentibacter flavum]